MKVTFQYKDFTIEVFDDSSFSEGPDSPTRYNDVYQAEVDKEYKPSSQHAIAVYDGKQQVANAILLSSAGATSVTDHSALIDNNNLIVRCGNVVFNLTIPELKLNWITEADPVTCFSIYQFQDSYISHGEISVSRIDRNGNLVWEYGGQDIFLRLDGEDCLIMKENSIILKDFTGSIYEIDYNGKSLHTISAEPIRKPWWKFW